MKHSFKKWVARMSILSIVLNSVSISLLQIPLAFANNLSGYPFTSSGSTFSGSSMLSTQTGTVISTGNIVFDYTYLTGGITTIDVELSGLQGNQSGSIYGGISQASSGTLQHLISNAFLATGSGVLTGYLSGSTYTGSKVEYTQLPDGFYSQVLTTNIQQSFQEDSLKQEFQIDTTPPTITGSILPNVLSNTGVSFSIIQILDASFSGATLEMIPEFSQIGTIKTLTGTNYTGGFYVNGVTFDSLIPATHYTWKLQAQDKVGHSVIQTGQVSTMANGVQTTNTSNFDIFHFPDASISGSGSMVLSITNSGSPRSFSGFGINIPKAFIVSSGSTRLGYFSGALAGSQCNTGNPPIIVTSNTDFNIIHCDLSQVITVPTGGKIEFSIFGIQRPSIAQTYTLTFNPISGSAGTNSTAPFQGTTNITSISGDTTPPNFLKAYTQNPNMVILQFSEKLRFPSSGNLQYSIISQSGAIVQSARSDSFNSEFIILETSNQDAEIPYAVTLSGITDPLGNTMTPASLSFTGMGITAPYIQYAQPNKIAPGVNNMIINIQGKNDVFSGSISSIEFGSGITVNGFTKISNNQLTANITTLATTFSGPRFLKVTFSNGQTAHLFNALIVETAGIITNAASTFQITADATRTNETANYFFQIPLYTTLGGNDSISIVFPYGYDVSGASLDVNSIGNARYTLAQDPNSSQRLKIGFANAILPTIPSIVSLKITGIKNPSTAGLYPFTAETKNETTQLVQEILQSPGINIITSPTGSVAKTITFQLKDTAGGDFINGSGAIIRIQGAGSNIQEAYFNANGSFTYTGQTNTKTSFFIEKPLRIFNGTTITQTDYTLGQNYFEEYFIDNKIIAIPIINTSISSDYTSVQGTISGASGEFVSIWFNNNGKYYEIALNSGNAIPSNTFNYSVSVPKNAGYTLVSIKPTSLASSTKIAESSASSWAPPKSRTITIGAIPVTDIHFSITLPSTSLTFEILNGSGSPLPQSNISLYSPSGQREGQYATTNFSGSATFNTLPGTYAYVIKAPGSINPVEGFIQVGTGGITKTISLSTYGFSINGSVTASNGTALSNVEITTKETSRGLFFRGRTDGNGNYQLLLPQGTWSVWGWSKEYGSIAPQTISLQESAVYGANFIVSTSQLLSLTGTISSFSGSGRSNVIVSLSSQSGTLVSGNQTITDSDGRYALFANPGNYTLRYYDSEYGLLEEVTGFILQSASRNKNIIITQNQPLTIAFTGSGPPSDISQFEWTISARDTSNGKKFSTTIKGTTENTFDSAPTGTYQLQIGVTGMGIVYSSGSFAHQNTQTLSIPLLSTQQPIQFSGIVSDAANSQGLSDAFIEIIHLDRKQTIGTKTNASGAFSILIPKNERYSYTIRKPGYIPSTTEEFTLSGVLHLNGLQISPITTTIQITGSLSAPGLNLGGKKAIMSIIGLTATGQETSKNLSQEVILGDTGSFTLSVPQNFGSGFLSVAAEGFSLKKVSPQIFGSSSINLGTISLQSTTLREAVSQPITPAIGGYIGTSGEKFALQLGSNALGDSQDIGTVTLRETSAYADIPGYDAIGGLAHEITANENDGSPITNLRSLADISLKFTGSELITSRSGITVGEVRSLQISYYDPSTESWIALPTTVSAPGNTLFAAASSGALLNSITGATTTQFLLEAQTDHFTLFTSLVSTVVIAAAPPISTPPVSSPAPSGGGGGSISSLPTLSIPPPKQEVSLVTGVVQTQKNLSGYFGNVQQSIALKSGKSLNEALIIQRNGKKVTLGDILAQGQKTGQKNTQQFVQFALGDTLSAQKGGRLEIAINGYTKIQLEPLASVKIRDAGKNFLTYEHLSGKVQYDFTKNNEGAFEYKIQGKTSYATIRGTALSVQAIPQGETYTLINGKIDVYNAKTKKTKSMVPGDVYTIYQNGKEFFTPAKPVCGSFVDVLASNEFCPYISSLANKGVVQKSNKYNPNGHLTRSETLKVLFIAQKQSVQFHPNYTFNDIAKTDSYAPYVSTAKKLGYIPRFEVQFLPNTPILRAEFLQILLKMKQINTQYSQKYSYQDVASSDWYAPHVSTAKKLGYISVSQKNFSPNNTITRAEAAKLISNIFQIK